MKPKLFTKKRVIAGSIILVVVLLAVGGIAAAQWWDKVQNDPADLFNQTAGNSTSIVDTETPDTGTTGPTPSASGNQTTTSASAATPTPTVDPYEQLNSQADKTIITDRPLNILLIGVDYAEERVNNPKQYVGKNFNSDVMLVLSVNFKKNKVDMISAPRDSYAKIANIDGIYKLNFSLTAGGGINDAGFMNVCKSVQGLLAGDKTPINYYIAVTMPVVKELTNAIGGVDYDVDVAFTIDGRSYKKGMQHMDGQAVLDYCRVRKGALSAQPGDLNRVNRQKKMLVAVFKKLQSTSSIFEVPKILTSMSGKVYTNMNFSQLAALAVFGSKLPEKNITMRTMTGSYAYGIFNRNYVLINQKERVKLIREVYGIDVPPLYRYDPSYAKLLWAYMQGETWLKDINNVLIKDAKLQDKKKLTDVATMAQLTQSMEKTRELMSEYKIVLYDKKKPVVETSDYEALQKQITETRNWATIVFAPAGYKVNWYVNTTKPGQMKMAE